MGPLIIVWLAFASIVFNHTAKDLQSEKQTVKLFEQVNYSYKTYYITIRPKGD